MTQTNDQIEKREPFLKRYIGYSSQTKSKFVQCSTYEPYRWNNLSTNKGTISSPVFILVQRNGNSWKTRKIRYKVFSFSFDTIKTFIKEPVDPVLEEKKGVIYAVNSNFVKIKLDDDLIVNFPRILFANKDFIRFGQHVKYQIKKDNRGIKYQEFVEDIDIKQSEYKDEILDILKSF